MRDDPVKICPECGGEVRRCINGGGGIIFKGSGFYVTDKGGGKTLPPKKDGEKPAEKNAPPTKERPSSSPAPACASCPAAQESGACATRKSA